MPKPQLVISKSKYILGRQCPKLIWYSYNRKDLIPPPDAGQLMMFAAGNRVGELAQTIYSDGIKIEREMNPHRQHAKSLAALKLGKPLFEAGFVHDGAYALADILLPVKGGKWDLIEVKMSASVKEEHIHDAAFQKYTYKGAGVNIRKCFLMHINTDYIKDGDIEPEKIFTKDEITGAVDGVLSQVEPCFKYLQKVIRQKDEPVITIGPHCKKPYECPLTDLCQEYLPDGHVLQLYRGGKKSFEFLESGILKLADIPADSELSDSQLTQLAAHRSGEAEVDTDAIGDFLSELIYPLYFLDFETIAPAIPIYDGTRPFENIPFQYSLHIIKKDGDKPLHYAYLAPGDIDPRPEILKQLKVYLGEEGSIIAYNASFEKNVIKAAAAVYPEYEAWSEDLSDRIVDLLSPFRKFHYYHPEQKGSASMKAVLPAMIGTGYEGLNIAEGSTASYEYMRVTFDKNVPAAERDQVRADLEKYCAKDTLGMVQILDKLREVAVAG